MKKFNLGLLTGVVGTLYALMVRRNLQTLKEYNEFMTDTFNSVPPSQRYGYEEDFPSDTRWEL